MESRGRGGAQKEFGKLSTEQVVQFFSFGRSMVLGKNSHLTEIVGEDKSAYGRMFAKGPTWTRYYFVTFEVLAALTYKSMGALWTVHNMAAATDPQAAALSFMENFDPALLGKAEPTKEEVFATIECLIALENCWKCISYYSVTMCEVVPLALEGNFEAIRVAAAIDPSIFWSARWAPVIAAMTIEREREFFELIGYLSFRTEKKREQSRMLRIAEFVLRDAGAFEVASADALLDLVAKKLGMRSELGENPAKALSELFRRCRRDRKKILGSNHAN